MVTRSSLSSTAPQIAKGSFLKPSKLAMTPVPRPNLAVPAVALTRPVLPVGGLPKGKTADLYTQSRNHYFKGAQAGDTLSQNNMGVYYSKPKGIAQDIQKAIDFYKPAAEAGDKVAQYNLGIVYRKNSPLKDEKEAFRWTQESAIQGYAPAEKALADCYFLGHGLPKKDEDKALYWYEKAYNNPERDKKSQFINLGNLYTEGKVCAKDLKKASQLYQEASDNGHSAGTFNLANNYTQGDGVPQDYQRALSLHQKALEQLPSEETEEGAKNSFLKSRILYKMGWLHREGKGTPQDFKKAFSLYETAGKLDHQPSQICMAFMHLKGEGTDKNLDQAEIWAKKALDSQSDAQKDSVKAHSLLGEIYQEKAEALENSPSVASSKTNSKPAS